MLVSICACLALATPQALGNDLLLLRDGRFFDELELSKTEGGVTVHYENGDVFVPDALVLDAVTSGESTFVPTTDEEKEKYADGLVPFEGRWLSPSRRERLVAERVAEKREAVEEALAHRHWANHLEEETRNFRFLYTIPEHICEGYRERMEAYFEIFCKDWRVRRDRKKPKLPVNFYASRKEFNRTSGAKGGTLAYFKFVEPYDLNVYYDRLDPARTETVLYHEANHYLQKLVNEDFRYPHWPGEALAEYYGGSEWDPKRKKLTVGLLQEDRLAEIQNDVARGALMPLERLVSENMYQDYTWGWSLVHFLMNDRRYEKDFRDFFIALATGRDVERERDYRNLEYVSGEEVLRAFRDYLDVEDDEDFEQLEEEWHAYVQGLFDQVGPTGLAKAAAAAARTGRPKRAKRLFQEAVDAGLSNAHMFHAYAEVLVKEGDVQDAIDFWKRAIELDPMTADYHYALGRTVARSDDEEGKRIMALAQEIDPEVDESDGWF